MTFRSLRARRRAASSSSAPSSAPRLAPPGESAAGPAGAERSALGSGPVPVRRLPAASTAPACRATTGPDSPPAARASTRGSPAGGSTHSAASSSSPSPSGSGRAEVNSSEPSGRNAGADSPFSDRVSRTGSPPSSGTSQSADTYRAPFAIGPLHAGDEPRPVLAQRQSGEARQGDKSRKVRVVGHSPDATLGCGQVPCRACR